MFLSHPIMYSPEIRDYSPQNTKKCGKNQNYHSITRSSFSMLLQNEKLQSAVHERYFIVYPLEALVTVLRNL